MSANLTIFQKGLVLVAIPLLFQLIFLGLYVELRTQSERAQDSANQSRQANTEAEEVYRLLAEAQNGMRGFVLTGDDTFLQPYEYAVTTVTREVEHLHGLLRDPEQQARAERIAAKAEALLNYLADVVAAMRAGDRKKAADTVRQREGKVLMDDLRRDLNEFLGKQDRLDREHSAALADTRRRQNWLIGGMVGLSVLLAVATTFLFSRTLTARLRVLNDNSRRLAEGQELRAPLGGTDEIARVDRTFHEIAETIRRRSADLAGANDALRRSNEALEQFASVASHDLQEPLRKIEAFGDRLRTRSGPALDETGRDYLERVLSSAKRMRTLINDLLTFARVTTRGQPFVPVDLTQAAHEVVSDLEGRIEQVNGRVEVGPLPTIDADPTQVRQLLLNLIGNGLKFHRPGEAPVVRIQGELLDGPAGAGNGRLCTITVRDNGIGFEEVYRDRIFELFQRLHGRNEYEGTGMGLAICRKIVERHQGTITARSAPGQGATFVVTLPVTQGAPAESGNGG